MTVNDALAVLWLAGCCLAAAGTVRRRDRDGRERTPSRARLCAATGIGVAASSLAVARFQLSEDASAGNLTGAHLPAPAGIAATVAGTMLLLLGAVLLATRNPRPALAGALTASSPLVAVPCAALLSSALAPAPTALGFGTLTAIVLLPTAALAGWAGAESASGRRWPRAIPWLAGLNALAWSAGLTLLDALGDAFLHDAGATVQACLDDRLLAVSVTTFVATTTLSLLPVVPALRRWWPVAVAAQPAVATAAAVAVHAVHGPCL